MNILDRRLMLYFRQTFDAIMRYFIYNIYNRISVYMSEKEEPTPKASITEPELIMSIAIIGHGCEDYTKPLRNRDYFRNNVRVYSRSCVPGVVSVGNIYQNQPILQDIC
jgi:hypothetical protein